MQLVIVMINLSYEMLAGAHNDSMSLCTPDAGKTLLAQRNIYVPGSRFIITIMKKG